MVNLVIVSHSAQLGQGVGELARQMLTGDGCKLAIAAGIDDPENPIGTDPIKVMEAIESVADTDHVLVLMAFDYPNGTYTIGSIPLLAVLLVAGWFGVRKRVHEIHSTAPTLRK